jgi:hypothetical protein
MNSKFSVGAIPSNENRSTPELLPRLENNKFPRSIIVSSKFWCHTPSQAKLPIHRPLADIGKCQQLGRVPA